MDKWGRQVSTKGSDDLKRFYDIHDDDEEEEEEEVEDGKDEAAGEDVDASAAALATARPMKKERRRREGKSTQPPTSQAAVEEDDEAEGIEDEGDDDAGDDYSRSYLSDRSVAPPSSDSDASSSPSSPSSPTSPTSPAFPNVLGSESDSDLSPTPLDDSDEELTEPIPLTSDPPTCRLAVVNLDWDKLRALDLFTLCRSFQGAGEGRVEEVSVYMSEFGKERMKEEDKYGPIGLYAGSAEEYRQRIEQLASTQAQAEAKQEADADAAAAASTEDSEEQGENDEDENDAEEEDETGKAKAEEEGKEDGEEDQLHEEGEEEVEDAEEAVVAANANAVDPSDPTPLDQERLRSYELSRLRYFYAVVRCSSSSTASHLYAELDGTELESTANKLDLRFIPDATTFDNADLRDRVLHSDVDAAVLGAYRPPSFATKALQHSRVELTWDGEEEGRKRLRKSKWGKEGEDEEDDLKVYLASEGEEDAYGSDAATEVSDDEEGEGGERVVLKRKARSRYTTLLASLNGKGGGRAGEEGGEGKGKEGGEGGEEEEEQVFEMTFEPGLKAKGEELVKRVQAKEEQKGETVFERRARLVREKKRERKQAIKAKSKGERAGGVGEGDDDEEGEEDEVSVDEDDDFFKSAFDDDDYLPAKGVKERAKAFFADDERKERPDKRANRLRREEVERGRGGEVDERKQKERAELELLLMPDHPVADEQQRQDRGYNLKRLLQSNKPVKGKRAKRAMREGGGGGVEEGVGGVGVDDFKVDTADARFAAMYERPEFSIDPTHPGYRATKEMERVLQETGKRRREEKGRTEQEVRERKQSQRRAEEQAQQSGGGQTKGGDDDAGLDALVRSVKVKVKAREALEEQRKRADAARKQSGAGKRLGEEALSKLNKRQKLQGDLRL